MQNRESTEGNSKSIDRKITASSEKDWSQHVEHMQVPKERDQVSGGVSVPCQESQVTSGLNQGKFAKENLN